MAQPGPGDFDLEDIAGVCDGEVAEPRGQRGSSAPDRVLVWDGRTPADMPSGGAADAELLALERDGEWWSRTRSSHRQRHYPEALAILQKIPMPDYWVAHMFAAMTQARLGNLPAAQEASQRIRQLWPEFEQVVGKKHLGKWIRNQPELIDDVIEGVQLAGFRLPPENE